MYSPLLDELYDSRMLMDPAVVHYNYRVGGWKRLHTIQEPSYVLIKEVGVERAFNNVAMQDPIIQGQPGQYGKSDQMEMFVILRVIAEKQ
jgi:hypothetical protein